MEELGSTVTIINKISTTLDNSFRITLDIDASQHELIAKLNKIKAISDGMVMVGFAKE